MNTKEELFRENDSLTELSDVELIEWNGGSPLTYQIFDILGMMFMCPYRVSEHGCNQVILFS